MRKLIAALLLIATTQLTVWAGTDHVIVELSPSAQASAVAGTVGGLVVQAIPGTDFYLMTVPSAAAFANHPPSGVVAVELNSAASLRPSGAIGIIKTSGAAEWYAQQPAMQLVNAGKAATVAGGRGIVIADINSRVDVGSGADRPSHRRLRLHRGTDEWQRISEPVGGEFSGPVLRGVLGSVFGRISGSIERGFPRTVQRQFPRSVVGRLYRRFQSGARPRHVLRRPARSARSRRNDHAASRLRR